MYGRPVVLATVLVAGIFAPSAASAQKDRFVDALIAFRAALGGTYGDEGPELDATLTRMASSLAAWDREAVAAEAELRGGLPDASGEDRLRRRIALASLMLDRDRWTDALRDLEAAVEENPDRAFAYLARGRVRDAAGDTAGAVRDFKRAWDLDRGDAVKAYWLVTRGLAAGALDDPGPPLDALVRARQAAGETSTGFMEIGLLRDRADGPVFAPAGYAEGFLLVNQGRYVEAQASFRAAASRDPLLIDPAARTVQLIRGSSSLRAGQHAAAIAHFEEAVAAWPASAEAHRLLGTAYHLAERPAESLEQLMAAIHLAPSNERARIALARVLIGLQRRREAEEALHEAIAALPSSAEARWALAQLYLQSDRSRDAIVQLDTLLTFPTIAGRGQLLWLLGRLHHRHQDFEAMTHAFSERVRLDLNNAVAHKELGFAHVLRGQRRRALAELLVAARLAPNDLETLARIGQIHLDDGRYARAETVLREVVARAPDMARARFALGTTLLRLGRSEEGKSELAVFRRLIASALEGERRHVESESRPGSAPGGPD